MIKKIETFIRLSPAKKILLAQTFGLSFYTYILYLFFNKQAGFGCKTNTSNSPLTPYKKATDISFAIRTIDKYVPWKNRCRHQAYQAMLLCNFYKIPCLIFVGFKKEDVTNEIQAHAWTTAGGQIITGFCNPDEYTIQNVYKNKW